MDQDSMAIGDHSEQVEIKLVELTVRPEQVRPALSASSD